MTGGMDNPVDVVFTPGGERIFTTTFLQHPGGGKRDGLIHAVYGGVYGKDHDPIYDHPLDRRRRDAGADPPGRRPRRAGLRRYESDEFGKEYQDNLFACLFNMHKVTRHVLDPSARRSRAEDEDFLVSDNLDFHPTDVLEDADGSLLVIDTGGWYKLCCPTSQLQKPDVLGAIYRVKRGRAKDGGPTRAETGVGESWPPRRLAELLDDRRARRYENRATKTLSKGDPSRFAAMGG